MDFLFRPRNSGKTHAVAVINKSIKDRVALLNLFANGAVMKFTWIYGHVISPVDYTKLIMNNLIDPGNYSFTVEDKVVTIEKYR